MEIFSFFQELLPLVFMFELAATTVPQPIPDLSSPVMQQFQQQYHVTVSFRQRARGFGTSVIVRGSVCNEKLVKEATRKLIETLIGSVSYPKHLGPVVQSIISLMKSLVNDSLSLLVRLKSSVLIFFAEKMWGAFALQKLLTFFRQKMAVFLCIICLKF